MEEMYPNEWNKHLEQFATDEEREAELRRLINILKKIMKDVINPRIGMNTTKSDELTTKEKKVKNEFYIKCYIFSYMPAHSKCSAKWGNAKHHSQGTFIDTFLKAFDEAIRYKRGYYIRMPKDLKYNIVASVVKQTELNMRSENRKSKKTFYKGDST